METKVDVLWAMDQAAHDLDECECGDGVVCPSGSGMRAARAIVAELVEADQEYDKAHRAWLASDWRTDDEYHAFLSAKARRAAALARITPAAQESEP